ncbi:hypothetical protein GUITHDRAFT_162222 [Guillardia theta CCMP2712]|uniref:Uncharacterized protein n=1 Tax=Guillardia theta (strain CCMP2712) TaxID=905079 RepID=L1JL17_GUITC|nr:hypothetical protein GUITHDRAFT_162222 [Guillardia theta CCMP2712]EKX49032.1 hypothetical protein GUITHDRAFT_162222 [Guillardia theta CCMP2712]|eukprot:XP_005836012.1 hypothetical protein GUITHDRAFT_162222 [Guillardia theta CCMP2712]
MNKSLKSRPSTANSLGMRSPGKAHADNPDLHPGRKLCYYWKREHEELKKMVEMGSIRFDTPLEIDVEVCIADRTKSLSLRESYKEGTPYNRYETNYNSLVREVESKLAETPDGDAMWNVKVSKNDPQRCLGPQSLDPSLRRPRLGSFEILLSWGSSNWSSGRGGRQSVVLFSKLNTLKFPNPPDVVDYLVRVLSGARITQFEVLVRKVPEGLPCAGALVEVHDQSTEEEFHPPNSHSRTDGRGSQMLHLPFRKSLTAIARLPASSEDSGDLQGSATFDVHGDLSKSICVPLVPPLPDGQVRIVLTWAEYPHEVFLKVKTPEGNIKSPSPGVEGLDIPKDILMGQQTLENAKFEVAPTEGGFGPISVLLSGLIPGRYHIYAHCEAYKVGGRDIGWSNSNAELRFYTPEDMAWEGARSFNCCGREEAGSWWDICFLEVSASGTIAVRSFNELKLEEPGYRDFLLRVVDLDGMLVPGAKVQVQPESSTQVGDFGVSDSQGEAPSLKNIRYETAVHEGFGPKVISLTQSMSGKFKLYVMNREDDKKIFACNPLVTIIMFNGIWKTFKLDAQSCLDRVAKAEKDEKLCCWHVCDLRIESDSRFSDQSILCEDVNKLLDHEEGSATIPLVRPDFFRSDTDLCFILSWGGAGSANLHMETPGRNVRVEEAETFPGSDKSMRMIGKNPRSCLLRAPLEDDCPWLSDSGSRRTNRAIVSAGGSMEHWNMQLTLFSKEGVVQSFLPSKSSSHIKSPTLRKGSVSTINNVAGQDPAGGRLVTVKINPARSDSDLTPSAQVSVRSMDETVPLRIFPAPLTPDHPEYTRPNEYRFFCEWGKYEVEVKDEKCHSPALYSDLLVSNQIQPSASFCMAAISDLDAKQVFITLSWASSPKDLDLCLCNQLSRCSMYMWLLKRWRLMGAEMYLPRRQLLTLHPPRSR